MDNELIRSVHVHHHMSDRSVVRKAVLIDEELFDFLIQTAAKDLNNLMCIGVNTDERHRRFLWI